MKLFWIAVLAQYDEDISLSGINFSLQFQNFLHSAQFPGRFRGVQCYVN